MASQSVGYHEAIWIAAALVGTASVICGTVLAGQVFALEKTPSPSQPADFKPQVEEDAYDVVSMRG
jgi:hypothetical protein